MKCHEQRKTYAVYHLFVESKKIQQISEYNQKKQTHRYKELSSGEREGEGSGEVRGTNFWK